MENRKAALITGGAAGIGKEVALMLAAKGIDIAINYSRSEKKTPWIRPPWGN